MESRGGGGSDPPHRGFRVGSAVLVAPAHSQAHINRGPKQVPDTASMRTELGPASVLHWTKTSTRFSPSLYLFRA